MKCLAQISSEAGQECRQKESIPCRSEIASNEIIRFHLNAPARTHPGFHGFRLVCIIPVKLCEQVSQLHQAGTKEPVSARTGIIVDANQINRTNISMITLANFISHCL